MSSQECVDFVAERLKDPMKRSKPSLICEEASHLCGVCGCGCVDVCVWSGEMLTWNSCFAFCFLHFYNKLFNISNNSLLTLFVGQGKVSFHNWRQRGGNWVVHTCL